MRTTLNIDDDVFELARLIATAEQQSIGKVVSELARRGAAGAEPDIDDEEGFPVFHVDPGAPPITLQMVESGLEDA